MSAPVLLVTGAAGHLGRRVVEILLAQKAGTVIAGTRDPAKVADLVAKGAEARVIDFDKPETLAAGLKGVDRLLLVSTDSLTTRTEQQKRLIEAATAAGVKHVVYTSSPAPKPWPENVILNSHFWTEQALAASPMGWTVLRNNIYPEIILLGLANALKGGTLYTATGKGGRNYVTREDCAATAAAALASDENGRRILEVSGPAPVTQDEIAAGAAEIAGKPLVHVAIPGAALREAMVGAGLPKHYAEALVGFDVDAAEGFHATTTPVVKDLTGRAPTSVKDFLAANAAAIKAMA